MINVDFKLLPSLEKVFHDEEISDKKALKKASMLQNEQFSFQIAYKSREEVGKTPFAHIEMNGKLAPFATLSQIVSVPSTMPNAYGAPTENTVRNTPGLYPDLLLPMHYAGRVRLPYNTALSLWVDVELTEPVAAGTYPLEVSLLDDDGSLLAKEALEITVLEATLADAKTPHTEWFYTDCLAEEYGVEVFSERHFEIIENYIKTALKNGINTIMMPLFTPELDTYIGGERLTTQLLGITRENGIYSFDFSLVDRWVAMCERCGVLNYEIPHLFSQWGAYHTPKIMATDNGEYQRIFGWETDAASNEYKVFLAAMLPALIDKIRAYGIEKRVFFHISDEPHAPDLESYRSAHASVCKLLSGFPIIDAVCDPSYVIDGMIPVPSAKRIEPFLEKEISPLWVYYCGGQVQEITNRVFAFPLARTRILGVQMYLYGIDGFLHWGYNYWHNQYSYDVINPYVDTAGEYFAPSGDMCLVYPAKDGTPHTSLRLKTMRDAFQDLRALQRCEELYDKEFTHALVHEGLAEPITFKKYPCDADYLLKLREKLNRAIEKRSQK